MIFSIKHYTRISNERIRAKWIVSGWGFEYIFFDCRSGSYMYEMLTLRIEIKKLYNFFYSRLITKK
jgi:hypothetical protein